MYRNYYKLLLLIYVSIFFAACGVYESSPLMVSIRSNDPYSVKSLIESGENVNALSLDLIDQQYWKLTPLIRASIIGNIEIIKMLLEAGADVNGKDEWGDTALMAAAEFGHTPIAKLLIRSGANVNVTKPDKTTALMIAARSGNFEMTDILLDAGADVNIGLGGDTALSLAAWKGNAKIVEALVKNGAIVDRMELLKWANENNHQNIIRLIESEEYSIQSKGYVTESQEQDKVYRPRNDEDMSIETKRALLGDPNYRSRNLNDPCKFHSDCVGDLMCINNVCKNR